MKYYIFLITAVLFFAAACNKNNQDYGLTAYQNKDYITAFSLSEKGCNEKNLQIYIIWGFHAKWTM